MDIYYEKTGKTPPKIVINDESTIKNADNVKPPTYFKNNKRNRKSNIEDNKIETEENDDFIIPNEISDDCKI